MLYRCQCIFYLYVHHLVFPVVWCEERENEISDGDHFAQIFYVRESVLFFLKFCYLQGMLTVRYISKYLEKIKRFIPYNKLVIIIENEAPDYPFNNLPLFILSYNLESQEKEYSTIFSVIHFYSKLRAIYLKFKLQFPVWF